MNPIISKAANERILLVIAAFYSLTRTMESGLVRFSPRKHAPVCISAHMQKKRRVRVTDAKVTERCLGQIGREGPALRQAGAAWALM